MAALRLTRHSIAPPGVVWDVLTDFAGYATWMPLTTVHVDPGAPRVGWGFVGLSGVGPLRFADPMLVAAWEPPKDDATRGRFRVVKLGRLLAGWADVEVLSSAGGADVRWTQDLRLRSLPAWLVEPTLARAAAVVYGRALDAMLAEAGRRAGVAR